VVNDTDLPTDGSHSPPPPDEQHSRVGQEARGVHPGSGQDQPPRGRAAVPWRAWLGWFAAFLLIGAGWALVAPLDQVPDEADHVYRAAAVVRGQVFPDNVTYDHGTGAIENVPVGLMRPAYPGPCGRFPNAWCSYTSAPPGEVTVVSGEGRMFPFYYALVGWPSLVSADRTGWYLMRLDNAFLCALMLATAAVVVMSLPRRPLVLAAAMLVGLTPDALSLTGAVNSSAVETAAALCYWAVLLALIHNNSALNRRLLVSVAVAAAVVLTLTREYDWLWAAIAMVLVLATAGRKRWLPFLRSRAARAMLIVIAASAVVTEIWSLRFKAYKVFPLRPTPLSLGGAVHHSLVMAPIQLRETLGYLAWDTIPPPAVAVVCWVLAVAAVVVIGFIGSRRVGLVVVAGLVLIVAMPFAITVAGSLHPAIGEWLGRYTLPLAVGIPLLAIARGRAAYAERRIVIALASVVLALVLCGQAAVFWHASTLFFTVPPDTPFVPTPGPTPHVDALIGSGLVILGALGVLGSILWAEYGRPLTQPAPETSRSGAPSPARS
jgi:predicted membrane protein DUF2142